MCLALPCSVHGAAIQFDGTTPRLHDTLGVCVCVGVCVWVCVCVCVCVLIQQKTTIYTYFVYTHQPTPIHTAGERFYVCCTWAHARTHKHSNARHEHTHTH